MKHTVSKVVFTPIQHLFHVLSPSFLLGGREENGNLKVIEQLSNYMAGDTNLDDFQIVL